MRIIVMSDSHGNLSAVEDIILRSENADWYIHLGDGERDVDNFLLENPEYESKIIQVAGNCDWGSMRPTHTVLPVFGHRIFITHGHTYAVKNTLDIITKNAKQENCDIVLFGHTHVRYEHYENGMYFLNPGSCSVPHDGKAPSFGSVDIFASGVITNITDV